MTLLRRIVFASALLTASSLHAQMTREEMRAMSAKYPPLPPPSNLKVLPKDIAIPDLVENMVRFSEGLGVQCTFCHAFAANGKELNFPADTNPNKNKARTMYRMMSDINAKYLAELPTPHQGGPVTCGTCHQGHELPPVFKPSPNYHLE